MVMYISKYLIIKIYQFFSLDKRREDSKLFFVRYFRANLPD
jgi:hypothetical protein